MTQTHCVVCHQPIHPERLAAIPHTKTCCHEHSDQRKRDLRAASSARCHRRKRLAKRRKLVRGMKGQPE